MRVVITGTPGTGKSAVAKRLAEKEGLELIDLKRIARAGKLVSRSGEVDVARLARRLSFLKRKDGFVAEGHLACEIRIPADVVIVLRCGPAVLERRLSRRGYGRRKLSENILSEMLDYCTQRVSAVYKREPLELETSRRTPGGSAEAIIRAIRHKKKRIDTVDYSADLERFLKVRK